MGSVAPNLPHPLDDDGMPLPIAIRDAYHSRVVEKNYRGWRGATSIPSRSRSCSPNSWRRWKAAIAAC